MTKDDQRFEVAKAVLASMVAAGEYYDGWRLHKMAEEAVCYADALLAELAKKEAERE